MKRIKISLLILILILTTGAIFPCTANASQIDPGFYDPGELQQSDVAEFEKFGAAIASVIQIVGTIVSVGTIMIIGIRYVVASADEKAEYRDRMIPYFIGAVLLFGASNVVNIIFKMFN
ncbi:MAG: hypothetical protein IJE59_01855 [Clostridia bacterium]|nr:hypothetical protein [Clostridia bacterium]